MKREWNWFLRFISQRKWCEKKQIPEEKRLIWTLFCNPRSLTKYLDILTLILSNGKGHISRTGQEGQLCNEIFREIHSLHSIFLILKSLNWLCPPFFLNPRRIFLRHRQMCRIIEEKKSKISNYLCSRFSWIIYFTHKESDSLLTQVFEPNPSNSSELEHLAKYVS